MYAKFTLYCCYTVAQSVCSINESISGGDAAATLSSLKSASVGIRSITDDCAATYQEKLAEAKQQKTESGERLSYGESFVLFCFCHTLRVLVHVRIIARP